MNGEPSDKGFYKTNPTFSEGPKISTFHNSTSNSTFVEMQPLVMPMTTQFFPPQSNNANMQDQKVTEMFQNGLQDQITSVSYPVSRNTIQNYFTPNSPAIIGSNSGASTHSPKLDFQTNSDYYNNTSNVPNQLQSFSERSDSSSSDSSATKSPDKYLSLPGFPSAISGTVSAITSQPLNSPSSDSASGRLNQTAGQKRKNTPYIPSYMDLTNGPEPCVVCGDAATGYHYRCMTCEGCKGFFRRTIQKSLTYHCKWTGNCIIDKTTRNQCQQCRYTKCLTVGMATDLVLNDKQRVAKRKLIEDNRSKRRCDTTDMTSSNHAHCDHDVMTQADRELIEQVVKAYEQTANRNLNNSDLKSRAKEIQNMAGHTEIWQQLSEVLTPSIIKVVDFAKLISGFLNLVIDDQILLLKSCCMEIMCLRAACRYDPAEESLTLQNGVTLTKEQLNQNTGIGLLIEPIFEFGVGLAKLQLDSTELALLAAVLLMQSDRSGLKEPENVEKLQDAILGAYKRYIAEMRPAQPVHWAKVLMKVTDLRSISTRHAERVLCVKVDSPESLPPYFLDMFDEGLSASKAAKQDITDSS